MDAARINEIDATLSSDDWQSHLGMASENDYLLVRQLNDFLKTLTARAAHRTSCARFLFVFLTATEPEVSARVRDLLFELDALRAWLYIDLQGHNKDMLLVCLKLFAQLFSERLPARKGVLGFNLIEFLIEKICYWDASDRRVDAKTEAVYLSFLHAFLAVAWQFEETSEQQNRVLFTLIFCKQREKILDLSQIMLKMLNVLSDEEDAEEKRALLWLRHIFTQIFSHEILRKSFLYTNDLKSFVEIVMRQVSDSSNEDKRRMLLEIFALALRGSEYRYLKHRVDDVVLFLDGIAEGEDNAADIREIAAGLLRDVRSF